MDARALGQSALFQGIEPADAEAMLDCLQAYARRYKRGEAIYWAGERVEAVGMVLSGSVHIESDDVWGDKSILSDLGPGEVFAEAYVCLPGEALMVSVVAAESAEILFLNIERVLGTCPVGCAHHRKLIQNLLTVMARKNLELTNRAFHTAPKTIRGKLLSYLSFQSLRQGKHAFAIPFNRQQLADYLGVDRSALSSELGKLSAEGLLTYEKNRFVLREGARPR